MGGEVSLVVLDLEGFANKSSQPHYRWTGSGSEQRGGIVGNLGDCGFRDLGSSVDSDNSGKPDIDPF